MAQRNQVSWAKLRVGMLVIVALTIFGLMVFLMTGQDYFDRKTKLVVYLENAGGLKKGDPVRLAGIDIGNIDDIAISDQTDKQRGVIVRFHVEQKMMPQVRQDSIGTLEVEGLLGQRFLDITRGTPAKPELVAGGELTFRAQPDLGDVISSSSGVLANVNHMITSLTKVSDQVEKGQGSLGKLVFDDTLYKQADKAVTDLQSMVSYANSGKGSLGKLVYTDELYNKVDGFVGKADGMLDDVKSQKGSLGKLMYDTSFHDDVKKFVENANGLVTDAKAGKGTLGKLIVDDTLYTKALETMDHIDSVAGRIDRGEGTLGKLTMKDDPLHANINNLSLELRDLIAAFKKNPKKYMTIQLKIF